MRRQLGLAAVMGLFGVLMMADVSEACHGRRRCAQPCYQTCYQPCAQPRGCGHRRCGGGGLCHRGRRVVYAGPACGGCYGGHVAYGGGYGAGVPASPMAPAGQMVPAY
jgi:hypothetical protein